MSKIGLHDPFGSSSTSYGQKKGQKSNCQFDSQPLEVKNFHNFLVCRWHATYHWKALNKGYNFSSNFISIRGLHTKLWTPKVVGIPNVRISGLPFGNPRTVWHLGAGPMVRHKVYYKGEGGGFPQVRAMVNLVSSWLPVAHPCTKMFQLRTNQLVVWFVQVRVNKWITSQSS